MTSTERHNSAENAREIAYTLRPVSRGEYNLLRSVARKIEAERDDFTEAERFVCDTYRVRIKF